MPKRKSKFFRRTINTLLLSAVLTTAFLPKILYPPTSIIDTPTNITSREIQSGDTYNKYALELKNQNKILEQYDTREIIDKLRNINKYNPGKLPIGEKIILPEYSTRNLF